MFTAATSVDNWIETVASIREPDGKWHPSSLFTCERQAVYEVRGTPPSNDKDNRNKRILHLGTTWHQVIQRAIAADPRIVSVYIEVPAEDDWYNISGHADAVALYEDGTWELFEIKSAGLFQWKKIANGEKTKGIPAGPKPDHIGQARTYAYALRKNGFTEEHPTDFVYEDGWERVPPLGDLLRTIRFIYICRDDLTIAEFVINVDPAWESDVLEPKMLRLQQYVDDGTALPPRLPNEKDGTRNWLCSGFCVFRDKCFNLDSEGVEL